MDLSLDAGEHIFVLISINKKGHIAPWVWGVVGINSPFPRETLKTCDGDIAEVQGDGSFMIIQHECQQY